MTYANRRRFVSSGLFALLSCAGLSACKSSVDACRTYADLLCESAGPSSSQCRAIKTATDLMPPAACAAGLKDVEYTTTKLAAAQKPCNDLAQKACAAVGPNTESCKSVTLEFKTYPPERCESLMEHRLPAVIAQLQQEEQLNRPLSLELRAAISQSGEGVSFGSANAKVQVVEFADFQCPYCAEAAPMMHQIADKYGDRVLFRFRQFPMSMHPNARLAAEAVLAANAQGKFWELHDRLFANQNQLDRKGLEEQARQAGLNLTAFKRSLEHHDFANIIDADIKLGQQVVLQGTPAIFVNGARLNSKNFQAAAAKIDAALNEQEISCL
jgi:protein-disulfide isomerase